MVSHLKEQKHDRVKRTELVSILFCFSFHPLLLLLEIFSKLSCFFQTWTVLILSPHNWIEGLLNRKVLPRCGRKRAPSDSVTFSLSQLLVFVFALLVCFALLFWVSLILCIYLFNLFLFFFFSVLVYFVFHIKNWKIRKIQKQCVFVYIGTCVPWMPIETKFSKLCIFCNLDEHLYAQLSEFCGSCLWWVD